MRIKSIWEFVLNTMVIAVLSGCANGVDAGSVVGGLDYVFNLKFLFPKEKPYENYVASDAARVRVVYGSGSVGVMIQNQGANGEVLKHALPYGEKTNKQQSGLAWNIAGVSLGMPGEHPLYEYSEIAVKPNQSITFDFRYYASGVNAVGRTTKTCDVSKTLMPKANQDYQITFEMTSNGCKLVSNP